MKKILVATVVLVVVLALFAAAVCGVLSLTETQASVGIIGGADGPTAIMVSGSLVNSLFWPLVFLGLAAVVVIIIIIKRNRRR